MGQIICPETSLTNYKSTLSNIPEERRSHLHAAEGCDHINIGYFLRPRDAYEFAAPSNFWRASLKLLHALLY